MKFRTGPELFSDLMEMAADRWNATLAKELGITLEELKYAFIMRDKIPVTEDRIKLDIYKLEIEKSGNLQKEVDNENLKKYESPSEPNKSDILHKPTKLDKYTIRVNNNNTIISSIACTGKIIVGMDFSKAQLEDSYFCHCIFFNCDFREANLSENTFQSCVFNSCSFLKTDFMNSIISKGLFIDCNMDNATLDCVIITDSPFIACQLNFTSFMQATLINTGFTDCDLMHGQFTDSKHVSSSWTQCNFTDSKFKRCRLTDLIIIKADFGGCDFEGSLVSCLTLTESKYDDKYIELFKMNHLLFSPSVMEWEKFQEEEKEEEEIPNKEKEEDEEIEDNNFSPPPPPEPPESFDSNYGEDDDPR